MRSDAVTASPGGPLSTRTASCSRRARSSRRGILELLLRLLLHGPLELLQLGAALARDHVAPGRPSRRRQFDDEVALPELGDHEVDRPRPRLPGARARPPDLLLSSDPESEDSERSWSAISLSSPLGALAILVLSTGSGYMRAGGRGHRLLLRSGPRPGQLGQPLHLPRQGRGRAVLGGPDPRRKGRQLQPRRLRPAHRPARRHPEGDDRARPLRPGHRPLALPGLQGQDKRAHKETGSHLHRPPLPLG